ncbi:MAG: ribosome rescue protein RqcH [Candidatus Hydrothermarchaeales archaeon]
MKSEMTSFDILAAVRELQSIVGARVNKVFQVTPSELKIQLHIKGFGRSDLIIEIGKRIHLTKSPRPSPKQPSNFAMTLRKYLGNSVITNISQVGFDRIVEIDADGREGRYKLIAELFGEGNAMLVDDDGVIKAVMKPRRFKHRELLGKRVYEYPPSKIDPFEVSPSQLKELVDESRSDLVRTLALTLGLGGLYAEEVCLRAGIAKDSKEIGEDGASKIIDILGELRGSMAEGKPRIVFDEGEKLDVTPIELEIYKGKGSKEFDSFNEALDEYFTGVEIEKVEAVVDKRYEEKLAKLRARLKDQEETLARFEKLEADSKRIGDLIYMNYNAIEEILKVISNARKRFSEEEILERLEESKGAIKEVEMIKEYLSKENALVVEIEGMEFKLDLTKNAGQNADHYYTSSKKTRDKIEGTRIAIEKTKGEIKKVIEEGKEAIEVAERRPIKRKVKRMEWYEKFRWFNSSDALLVIGGRDANSNEVIVKRHMEKNDIFVHADIHGAPAVVIKAGGKEIPEGTIKEAMEFAAAYSRAWKNNLFALDVYWVKPEQVSKTPEHGEYVAKGAFIIRGKRNWSKVGVKAAIGVTMDEDTGEARVIGGPVSAIEKNAKYYVKIIPGRRKPKEVAEMIKSKLLDKAKKGDKEEISKLKIDEIQQFLPAGGHELEKGSRSSRGEKMI